jgi:exosortase D (VPLPA-CTERM-specific)
MTVTNPPASPDPATSPDPAASDGGLRLSGLVTPSWGLFWLAVAILGAAVFFWGGIEALLRAWQKPEYSHGPLIPVLSLLLFLRQLKEVPVQWGAVPDRWPGVAVMGGSVLFGLLGNLSGIDDAVAYALILWIWGVLLTSFGWKVGLLFWPPVLHLVYMLPLPDTFYYKLSNYLQMVSSEIGVDILRLLGVPVFLEGNIIDLGVLKLHVAEACSGLRYLFPILSFSYIFAVLYQGPMWHKAVLLVSAAPITVLMNSVRIAIAGVIVDDLGVAYLEGFTHFFEGWVIFLCCVLLLFALAWVMLLLRRDRVGLVEALDLDTTGLGTQAARLQLVRPSPALIAGALLMVGAALAWNLAPERGLAMGERDDFSYFPDRIGQWEAGPQQLFDGRIERRLGADDYYHAELTSPEAALPVNLFMGWYADQSRGGIHSPEVCLPGGGWEIAWIERVDMASEFGTPGPFPINQVIIQKGQARMMAYYWFDQQGRVTAWDLGAKMWLLWSGITTGRKDGAIVRLITPMPEGDSEAAASARLTSAARALLEPLPRFIPQ